MNDIPDFTVVLGVDRKHLEQLSWVWPTWLRHKPSMLDREVIVFHDQDVTWEDIVRITGRDLIDGFVPWPPPHTEYSGDGSDKWNNPQRHKMLAGFVHVPDVFVTTPYWLKLDTDAVAVGEDEWIKSEWFQDNPAIISHKWGFSRPPDIMERLDEWVEKNDWRLPELASRKPLNLKANPGWDRVCHKRIGSWCGFFRSDFTRQTARWARETCGPWQIPVASQDSYFWYAAKRMEEPIIYLNMKRGTGWQLWSTSANVRKHAEEAMGIPSCQ